MDSIFVWCSLSFTHTHTYTHPLDRHQLPINSCLYPPLFPVGFIQPHPFPCHLQSPGYFGKSKSYLPPSIHCFYPLKRARGADNIWLLLSLPYIHKISIIYIGCHRSLKLRDKGSMTDEEQLETISSEDAYKFPLVGSCVLFSLYLAFKVCELVYITRGWSSLADVLPLSLVSFSIRIGWIGC